MDNTIVLEPTMNAIELEPTRNNVEVETIKIETISSFISIAQPVAEHKEVG